MLKAGQKVKKNPETWVPNAIDERGRGHGIGVVLKDEIPCKRQRKVDIEWPIVRCFERVEGLILVD